MAGIYLHIPFCRQACNYCDFYFSTRLSLMEDFVSALVIEIELQKHYFPEGTILESVYFGGGTPSLLSSSQLIRIFNTLRKYFLIKEDAEITLETNPDDLNTDILRQWKETGINRLSLGLQSIDQSDLTFMHRVHTSRQSLEAVNLIRQNGFNLYTLDFIYGLPNAGMKGWLQNLAFLKEIDPPHFSAYALTVEPCTRLFKEIQTGKTPGPEETEIAEQFMALQEFALNNGYDAYEISNYSKPGCRAIHNSAYWHQKPYLGLGPAAHSFQPGRRRANKSDLKGYILNLLKEKKLPPAETEFLTLQDQTNEWLMTRLRLQEGISSSEYQTIAGHRLIDRCENILNKYIKQGYLTQTNTHWKLTLSGKLHADGIASELFWENDTPNS